MRYAAPARPRLVATDLDGTLLRSDGSVSGRTRAAVAGLASVDVEFVLVTARPPRWLDELAEISGSHGTALCGNGAFVYDVRLRQVTEHHGIPPEVVDGLVADLRAAVPGILFAAERHTGLLAEPAWLELDPYPPPPGLLVAAIEDRDQAPVGKLLALRPGWSAEHFLAVVEQVVGDRAHVAYSGAGGLAEINALGVTKAAVLARFAAGRGIAAEQVWAFGDMPNDLPMLRWAGRSFAVANAHPAVLAVVDDVIPANDADGVAVVLETQVLGHREEPTASG